VALASVVKNLPDNLNFIFPDLFIRIELDTNYVHKEYLAHLFNSVIGRYYFKYAAKGKNQTMVKVSYDELNNFYLPIPKLEVQQKIVDEIKAELENQEKIKTKIERESNKIYVLIEKTITYKDYSQYENAVNLPDPKTDPIHKGEKEKVAVSKQYSLIDYL
jgi:type I restriction enzyme S subunit